LATWDPTIFNAAKSPVFVDDFFSLQRGVNESIGVPSPELFPDRKKMWIAGEAKSVCFSAFFDDCVFVPYGLTR
jgi:hypothetical protein